MGRYRAATEPPLPDRNLPEIHPSAIVDPTAELADDVYVGPHCVIEAGVRLGAGCHLVGGVWLRGPLVMGENNRLYPDVSLGFEPQDRKFDPNTKGTGILVGNNNLFREGVSIHRATGDRPTTIGNDNFLMVNCHLGHDVIMGDRCTMANGVLIAGHVVIGNQITFGGNAVVHQFCRLGRLSMLSGGAALTQDVPPFCVAYGSRSVGSLNLIGLRRAGYREHIRPLKLAYDILFKEQRANTSAAAEIRERCGHNPLCREFADFIAGTTRGITQHYKHTQTDLSDEPATPEEVEIAEAD